MAPKSKFLLTLLCAIAIGFGIIIAWMFTGRDWVGYMIFVWVLIATWVMYQIKCPNCGAPVAYSARLGKVQILSAIPRRTCEECGYDLTRNV